MLLGGTHETPKLGCGMCDTVQQRDKQLPVRRHHRQGHLVKRCPGLIGRAWLRDEAASSLACSA